VPQYILFITEQLIIRTRVSAVAHDIILCLSQAFPIKKHENETYAWKKN
jgi:hypothetical protein